MQITKLKLNSFGDAFTMTIKICRNAHICYNKREPYKSEIAPEKDIDLDDIDAVPLMISPREQQLDVF